MCRALPLPAKSLSFITRLAAEAAGSSGLPGSRGDYQRNANPVEQVGAGGQPLKPDAVNTAPRPSWRGTHISLLKSHPPVPV